MEEIERRPNMLLATGLPQAEITSETNVLRLFIGQAIAVEKCKKGFPFYHLGVVSSCKTVDGQVFIMVAHLQRPSSQAYDGHGCKCGYRGPKDGEIVESCIQCFSQGDFVFKIRFIEGHLTPDQKDLKGRKDLKPGTVFYEGYCNNKYYRGYYLSDGRLVGYLRVTKKDDSKQLLVDNRVRFVEKSKRSAEDVLNAVKAALAGMSTIGSYSLLWNNCEHIAMLFMTGKRISFQVRNSPRSIVKLIVGKIRKGCVRTEAVAVADVEFIEQNTLGDEEQGPSDEGEETVMEVMYSLSSQRKNDI